MPVSPYEGGASSARLRPQQGKITPMATFTRDDFDRDGKNRFASDTLFPVSAFTRHDNGTGAVLQPCLLTTTHGRRPVPVSSI